MGIMAPLGFFLACVAGVLSPPRGPTPPSSRNAQAGVLEQHQAAAEESEAALLEREDHDIEHGVEPPPHLQQAEDGADDVAGGQTPLAARETRTKQLSSTTLKEHLRLSFLEIITATGVLTNLFFIRRSKEPISKNPTLIVASASAFASLLSGFGLMFVTMRQMIHKSSASWSKLLHCLSTLSLAFTVITVMVSFLPKPYHYLPVVLVPTLPVVAVSFYNVRPKDHIIVLGDHPHKADRKRSYQLTINMTTFAFMGALGTLVGNHKNSSNQAGHVCVEVAIYLMLGASLTGLVTLLLIGMLGSSKDWKKTGVANAVMLSLLVPAVLMEATIFLGWVTAATGFPLAIAAGIWYFLEYITSDDDDYDQEDMLKPLYGMALTAMSLSFGTVVSIFAGILSGVEKGKNLEVCIFFVVSCFVSSVTLGVLTFRTPKKASVGETAKVLGYLTLVLLVVAALALVSYVGH